MGRRVARVVGAFGIAAVLAAVPAGAVGAADGGGGVRCRGVTVPVAIAEGRAVQYEVAGELCAPAGRGVDTVQVLVHGLNYSHVYWDFPLEGGRYSYVRRANRAGYATFNVDRIGVGRSSHPPSGEVTLESNAFTVHQVVGWLRQGAGAGQGFRRVVVVGHSYGSEVAKLEASVYGDVDGLVLTGNVHRISASAAALAGQLGQSVQEVPRLAREVPAGDGGYVTVQDRSRPLLMYSVPDADPRVIAVDIATKETNTFGEISTIGDANAPGLTARVHVPLLIVDGVKDRFSCAPDATDCSSAAAIVAAEQPFYPGTRVDAVVIPDAGHAINLHRNAQSAYCNVIEWLDRYVRTG